MSAFRASLIAMADCGRRALPALDEGLSQSLTAIESSLAKPVAAERIDSAARKVEAELECWAARALDQQSENEREMKEIIAALSRAAEAVGARDEKYSKEIAGMTGNLRGIALMKDLGAIRRSIVETAASLRTCVERMAEESRLSVARLTGEIDEYRSRLEASEKLSTTDTLTNLANRRAFEQQLEARIAARRPFGLMMLDLDNFKSVNDAFGHLAGDDLLRQFSAELRARFPPGDVVARWGGDEFAVLFTPPPDPADDVEMRVRRWALGQYRPECGGREARTALTASIGTVQWDGSETGTSLLARADALACRTKVRSSPR